MIMRMIDDLGRIVIPKDIRKSLGISMGDVMDMSLIGKSIVLTKHFKDKKDELLSSIAMVEDEELRNKLFEAFYEWCNGNKEREENA